MPSTVFDIRKTFTRRPPRHPVHNDSTLSATLLVTSLIFLADCDNFGIQRVQSSASSTYSSASPPTHPRIPLLLQLCPSYIFRSSICSAPGDLLIQTSYSNPPPASVLQRPSSSSAPLPSTLNLLQLCSSSSVPPALFLRLDSDERGTTRTLSEPTMWWLIRR